ncbi:MAG: hypothetical protein QG567_777 [Campylobacterota bacterium]|nr:hypothetical protein [Campylobacterota bacterium]
MLDADLAELYGVETKQLNKAVNRNLDRFPQSFRFQLTQQEFDNLRFQNGTSSEHGGRRYLPFVFTEQRLPIHDENFNKIFNAIEDKSIKPEQGIFPHSHHSDGNAYMSLYGCNMHSNAGAFQREKNSTFK